jgi:hypothetical protein
LENGATRVLGTPVPDDATAFHCVAVTAFQLPVFLVPQRPLGADTALTLGGNLVTFSTFDNTADFRFFSGWIGPELSPPDPTAPTPEPDTLVPLGSSLAILGWRVF